MSIDRLTPDEAILEELGTRLARTRKQQGRSQQALAQQAGIGVATLRRIEDGRDSQLGSWLKILKALGLESSIEGLLPASVASPRAEVLAGKPRRRSKRSKQAFEWGDERP
ncbi:MAG: transcriptional regulator with XRE-family HTH domain [Planctomycetota bacterium]|jgi:transcriptional regulator with XRE-family HTH domain